jgi:hypothetical protein
MFIPTGNENIGLYFHLKCDALYTECLKIRQFRFQIGTPPTKKHWSEGALFELRFLQIQAEKFNVYFLLWCR